jgi:hypothetical protein
MGSSSTDAEVIGRQRFTGHQVPRGTMADIETHDRIYVLKTASTLHATYQVRLLLFKAVKTGKKLVLRVPKSCKLCSDLVALRREHPSRVLVERV